MSDQVANSEPAETLSGEEFNEQIPVEPVEETAGEPAGDPAEAGMEPEPAQNARFEEFGDAGEVHQPEPNLDVILNIPVTLSMEVGRTRMTIQELMELKRGSVVKFNRLAGEPMDVLVNGTLIAHGEVVVINDKFGIRLIDVISPAERVRKLR